MTRPSRHIMHSGTPGFLHLGPGCSTISCQRGRFLFTLALTSAWSFLVLIFPTLPSPSIGSFWLVGSFFAIGRHMAPFLTFYYISVLGRHVAPYLQLSYFGSRPPDGAFLLFLHIYLTVGRHMAPFLLFLHILARLLRLFPASGQTGGGICSWCHRTSSPVG